VVNVVGLCLATKVKGFVFVNVSVIVRMARARSKSNSPSFEMNLELINIWRNVGTLGLGSQRRLLHAKHGGRKSRDSFHLKCSACLEAFPSCGDLDAHPLLVEIRGQVFKDIDDTCIRWLVSVSNRDTKQKTHGRRR
jgi:hypothetical protein